MGSAGTYGRFRAVGPIAAALSGVSEMSGLPEPAMPAGWGYSYLDWIGAYSFATAMLAALHYRDRTGHGQWIDASQTESGIFISGARDPRLVGERPRLAADRQPFAATLGRPAWDLSAAPGQDRWLAIACFTDDEWAALADADRPGVDGRATRRWPAGSRTRTSSTAASRPGPRPGRLRAHGASCRPRGVPAGVCQTAGDRCDRDPQLAHLNWLTEVDGTKIGRWPVAEVPVKLSATPAYIGGADRPRRAVLRRGQRVGLGELLGMSKAEMTRLADEGVI